MATPIKGAPAPGVVMKFIILVEVSLLIITTYSVCLLVISKLSPLWDRVWSFNWTNLNPLHPGILCQVWLKLAQWFWKRRFLKVVNLFFPNYLPFGNGVVLYLSKLKCPSPKDILCQVWLKLAQWFLRKRMWKNLQTGGQKDRRRTTGDQKSSIELWQLRWAKIKRPMGHIIHLGK